jgi:hypothetical protein
MLRFKSLFIISFLLMGTMFGQQTPDAFMFSSDTQRTAVIPQSPEVGNLGKYGSIPIASASGQMSYSIPFYDIEVDGHNWPVGLNYNYGGLILEGKPSLMGLGWYLQGEAAITREVRGLADEHKNGYNSVYVVPTEVGIGNRTTRQLVNDYIYNEFDDEDTNNSGLDTWTFQTLKKFRDGFYDSEPDKYTVNIGSRPFSFKINLDLPPDEQVYFLSKHSNKVKIFWSSSTNSYIDSNNLEIEGFEVTDENGIKYKFDVKEYTVPQGIDEEFYLKPTTAWKLSKITFLNNQKITFGYTPNILFDYNFRVAASAILANVGGLSANPNGYEAIPFQPGNSIYTKQQYGDEITITNIHRNILTSINFPKGNIELSLNSTNTLYQSFKLYDQAVQSKIIKKYNFLHSGNRDLLNDIIFNNEMYYQFEYYDGPTLNVPDFINSVQDKPQARMQDFWKFYNGASNDFALNIPNSQVDGVNRNPSFLHSRLGALKRIIYPTKGSTHISYQQNQIESNLEFDDTYLRSLPIGKRFLLELDAQVDTKTRKTKTIEFLHPTVAIISHSINGDRSGYGINLELIRTDGESNYPISVDGVSVPSFPGANAFYYVVAPYLRAYLREELKAPFTIPPMCPNLVEEFGYADTDNDGSLEETINRTTGDKILIMPGTYEMSIEVGSLGANVRGSISIQMYGSFNEPFPNRINKNIGGIRVDYMKDCPNGFGEDCVITDYSYNDVEGFSTGVQYVIPQLKTFYTLDHVNLPGENTIRGAKYSTQIVTFTENPFTVSDPLMSTPVFYKKITTTKRKNGSVNLESNATIGKTETIFSLPKQNRTFFFPKHPTGKDLDKSLPLETYSFEGGKDQSVSSNKNTYQETRGRFDIKNKQDEDNRHPWGLKVHINSYRNINFELEGYDNPNPTLGSIADIRLKALHGVKAYREIDNWDRLVSTANEIDGVSTSVNYKHNNDYKVIEETETDSRGNILLKEIQYANEAGLNEMVNINQISTPVEVKSYYNSKLQSTQKTEFILNGLGYKTSRILTAKGNSDLEGKAQFSYYDNGKLKQIDKLLDLPNIPRGSNEEILKSTAYIWGYNNEYPVVQVENATYNEIVSSNANIEVLRSPTESLSDKKDQLEILSNDLPNAFVSGYVHKPLVGISNMIDSRGYTTNYEYDFRNRLLNVKDENQKLIKEFEYKFRSINYETVDDGDFIPISANIEGLELVNFNDTKAYVANITGGSGNFSYNWYFNNNSIQGNSDTISVTFDSGNSVRVSLNIVDIETGQSLLIDKIVSITSNLGDLSLVSNRLIAGTGDPFAFIANGLQSGSGNTTYDWFINGTIQDTGSTTTFGQTFNTPGSYVVKLIVKDNETLATTEDEISVTVYNSLSTPIIDTDKLHVFLFNKPIDFTAQNVGGGTTNKSYSWSINGNTLTGEAGLTISENLSLGDNVVSFIVRDNILNKTETATITVKAYEFLSIDSIYSNVNNETVTETITGNMVRFIAQGFSGNAYNQNGQWYLNGIEQVGETSTIMDRTLNQTGNYTATYRRTHKYVTNSSDEYLYKEKSTQIEVFADLTISDILTNPDSPITVNTNTSFNINPITGSGSYAYLWNYNGYSATSKSFNLNLDYNYYGTKTASCKVTDTRTGISKTIIKYITVNGAPSLTAKQVVIQVFNSNDIEYNSKIGISNLNGSGNYSYSWTVDGQNSGSLDNTNIYMTCSDQSDNVVCAITDNISGNTKTVTKTYTFTGNCNGGGTNQQ